jgi:hypothetical protein
MCISSWSGEFETSNKKRIKIGLLGTASIALLLLVVSGMFLESSGLTGGSWHTIAEGSLASTMSGIPDAYGNRIQQVKIWQNSTGTWSVITSIFYTVFTNGSTLSIPANQKTIVEIGVYINDSLVVPNDLTTAIARTRVYLTITGVTTSTLMTINSGDCTHIGVVWILSYEWPSTTTSPTSLWTPATDTTYSTLVQYQAYY